MKKILTNISIAILFMTGMGLLILFNLGILSFKQPYARSIPKTEEPQNSATAFQNVNIIPMDSERTLKNQTLIVRDGVIDQIGPSAEVDIPNNALIVDGSGKFLIPGLVDMHVHVVDENELLLFAAHGVTTIRNLWGGLNGTDHLGWRAQLEAGTMLGPTLYTSGPIMEGPPKTVPWMKVHEDPASAAAAVNQQIEQGYDFIKVYDNLSPTVYDAVVEAARARGGMVVGHTPKKVGIDHVLESGQVTLEHISGLIDADAGAYSVQESELPYYAQKIAEAGAYVCPTIAVYQLYVPNEDLPRLENRPEMIYISPRTKFMWRYFQRPGSLGNITYQGDYPARMEEMFISTTRLLHEQGVQFILGSDTNNPYLVPGVSLLDELDYLVEAGFTPYEALETGTRNAAEALGELDEFGTLEVGKRADMILLDSNPLEDVSAVRDQRGVMLRGRWLPENEIQTYLDELVMSYQPNPIERIWPLGIIALAFSLGWRRISGGKSNA